MYLWLKILLLISGYGNKEWSLNERFAKSRFDQFVKPEIDLLASRLNTKRTKYASYKPDSDPYHVSANANSYIFPPFSIVGRVLDNLHRIWRQPW